MKSAAIFLLGAATLACGQQTSVVRNSDGSEIVSTRSDASSVTEKRVTNLNGRSVPVERVEERVLESDGSSKVIERIIRRYDQDGRPTPPERIRVEERKNPDGGSTTTRAVYRADLNGSSQLAERSVTRVRQSANASSEETVIERPNLNGAFDVAERREATTEKRGNQSDESVVVYRPTANGGFVQALRETVQRQEQDGAVVENKTQYEPGATGRMQVTNQTVTRTTTAPDGSTLTQVDLYSTTLPGRPEDPDAKPRLREQQVVERRREADASVREVISVRRASPDDTGRLAGPAQVISESVCKGDCKP